MKIGITSYPMLWQRTGGLQVQIRHTIDSLRRIGVDAKVFDVYNNKISDFDIIHVFSATHGMYLTLQEARLQGVKTVVSPVFQPDDNLGKYKRFRLANWLLRQITSNEVKSSFDYIGDSLRTADRIIALSQKELAKLVGTQQSAVSRYEKEDCFQMSIRQLNKVAHALGKKVEIRLCD